MAGELCIDRCFFTGRNEGLCVSHE
jgi:hypothetical protein